MAKASFKPDFEEIAVRCSGMLAPAVYERIYEIARRSPGGLLVEVGTAKGAATVALALGLRDSGRPGRVISFDRGRQRNGKGNPQQYRELVKGNLRHFGVEELVDLFVGEVSRTVRAVPDSAPISVLMLDADGAIDRDLGVFLDRIVPGGAVIIDDSADLVKLDRVGFSTVRIDAKMRLTFLLLSYFKDKGVLSEGTQIKDTYFGEKLRGLPDDADNTGEILEIYRELTFASAKHSPLQTARVLAIRTLKTISPSFTQRLRVRHRRRISADRMIRT